MKAVTEDIGEGSDGDRLTSLGSAGALRQRYETAPGNGA
jgi:hypothetical protein